MGYQNGTRNVVHLFYAGRFGKAVQQHMLRYRDDLLGTATTSADPLRMAEDLKSAKMLAFAAWRPDRKLCASLDRVAHETRKPFIPLIVEQNKLRLGPVIVPGRSSCWTCWNRRTQQNFPWQAARHALLEFYDANPESGPEGYLETVAAMSAAKMAQVLAEIEKDHGCPGLVWQLDLITRHMDTYTTIGIHDCPRCGLQRPPQTRSVDLMSQELEWLWKQQLSNPNA